MDTILSRWMASEPVSNTAVQRPGRETRPTRKCRFGYFTLTRAGKQKHQATTTVTNHHFLLFFFLYQPLPGRRSVWYPRGGGHGMAFMGFFFFSHDVLRGRFGIMQWRNPGKGDTGGLARCCYAQHSVFYKRKAIQHLYVIQGLSRASCLPLDFVVRAGVRRPGKETTGPVGKRIPSKRRTVMLKLEGYKQVAPAHCVLWLV
jgi:hypothetical protein